MMCSIKDWKPGCIVIPDVPLSHECSADEIQRAVEASINALFPTGNKNIAFVHESSATWSSGHEHIFTIYFCNLEVFMRNVSARFTGSGCEIIMSLGWWWTADHILPENVRENGAIEAALKAHKEANPDVADKFKVEIEKKVFWPELSGHAAYEVNVGTVTYFVSTHDGSILDPRLLQQRHATHAGKE